MARQSRGGDATWYVVPGEGDDSPGTAAGVESGDGAECSHASLDLLGADNGGNEYYRCEDCEDVLIKQGTRDFREVRAEREDRSGQKRRGFLSATGRSRDSDDHWRRPGETDIVERLRELGRRLLRK